MHSLQRHLIAIIHFFILQNLLEFCLIWRPTPVVSSRLKKKKRQKKRKKDKKKVPLVFSASFKWHQTEEQGCISIKKKDFLQCWTGQRTGGFNTLSLWRSTSNLFCLDQTVHTPTLKWLWCLWSQLFLPLG